LFLIFAILCLTNAIEVAREDPNAVAEDSEDDTAPAESKSSGGNKVSEAEEDLKNTRKGVHGGVNAALEKAAEAADVAVNANGKNFSDHLDTSKAMGTDLSGKLDELATKRARVSKVREEQRKKELGNMSAPTGAAAQDEPKTALPKVIYKGPPTDLLEKLVNATNNQVKQDSAFQKAQLDLQKKRMASMGIDLDEDSSADDEDSPDGRKVEKTNYDHILLAPGRAQAKAHCGMGILKTSGFRWCNVKKACLNTHSETCPGDEWTKPMKKEVQLLTKQLGELRRVQLMKDLGALKGQLNVVKKMMGLKVKEPTKKPQVRPAGVGAFGRLKGHAYSLRRQIKRLAKQLKVPVPEDTFAHKNLPMPANEDGTPGSQQGQAGEIMKKLSALVNQIAITKNRHIIAELNREVDALTTKLRTMTVGAHCLACGKAHCHINDRDAAQLWPKPLRCGCNDLAHPGCPCPKNCGDKFKPKKTNKKKCQCIPTCPCPHPPALCGDPGTPRHMVRLGMTYSENSTLHFLCQPPFHLKGNEFRTCTAKQDKWKTGDGAGGWKGRGTWSGKQPHCAPPSCGKPDDLEHGEWIGNKFEFPHRIEPRCHNTFTLDGPKVLQCMADGHWNHDPDTILCIPLQEPSNVIKSTFDQAKKDEAQAGDLETRESLQERLQKSDEPTVNGEESKMTKKKEKAHAALRGVTIDEHLLPGVDKIPVEDAEAKGFRVGMNVHVGADTTDMEAGQIKEITEGNIILEKALSKEHDPGEILRLLPESRTNMTAAQKKRSVADAAKGAQEDSLSAAADFMARKNEDIETGTMKDMERALLNSQRSLDNSKAARDEAAALVLANSPSSGIPPALRDPTLTEASHRNGNDTARNEIARNALAESTLSRPKAQLEEDQKHEMAGRAGQDAAVDASEKYVTKILDMKEYKKDDRQEIIDRAIAVGKAAGYSAGARQDTEDEGARVGRNAAISNVAKMLADTLGVSAKELLKDANSDILAMSKETKSGEEIAQEQEAEEKEKEEKKKDKESRNEETEKAKEEAKEKAEKDAEAEKDMTPAQLQNKKEQDKKAEEAEQALDDSKAQQAKAIDEGASPEEVTAQAVKDAKEAGKEEGKKEANLKKEDKAESDSEDKKEDEAGDDKKDDDSEEDNSDKNDSNDSKDSDDSKDEDSKDENSDDDKN